MAVRQVSAMRQVHSQHRVAWLQHRQIHRHVGLTAGVRLHIGMLGAEEFFCAFDGKTLHNVGILTPAVVTPARIPLRIFVRENRTACFQDSIVSEVFGRDHFQAGFLTAFFILNCGINFRIDLSKWDINAIHRTSSRRLRPAGLALAAARVP